MNRDCPVTRSAERSPSSAALVWADETWTYAQLDERVSALAWSLRGQGVGPGARVVVRSWNDPSLVVLFHALGRLGAVFVPLNARLTEAELVPLIALAGEGFVLAPLPSALQGTIRAVFVPRGATANDDVAAALFTSGTTGQPRLVEVTHANFFASAAANAANLGGSASQRWLGTLPLFHIGGLAMAHRCAVYGAALLLEPQFEPQRACALIDRGVTHASFVPTTLERLLDARGEAPFRGVEGVLIGGGPMGPALLARARRMGLPVLQTYGLTEACSQVATERPAEADGQTAGHPLPGLEVRVVDAQRAPVAAGVVGELEVRGPTVVPAAGEWLVTKDLGSLDARGRITIHARRQDLIISGGENVYPAEVEHVLREHPAIADVALVARPDASWGQVPVAFVVLSREVADEELTAWARERLAGFKLPRAWIRLGNLPRNANGKVERIRLAELAMG